MGNFVLVKMRERSLRQILHKNQLPSFLSVLLLLQDPGMTPPEPVRERALNGAAGNGCRGQVCILFLNK